MNGLQRGHVPVRVLAWGVTRDDAEIAVARAGFGPGRAGWEFVDVQRAAAVPCPINLDDPRAVAVDRDATAAHAWAYAVYRAD